MLQASRGLLHAYTSAPLENLSDYIDCSLVRGNVLPVEIAFPSGVAKATRRASSEVLYAWIRSLFFKS